MADTCMDATCGDLFDHIDDLLDFSKEEDEALLEMAESSAGNAPLIAPPPLDLDSLRPPPVEDDAFLAAAAGGGGGGGGGGGVETVNVGVGDAMNRGKEDKFGACEDDIDMVQLEWLSNFFDDTTTDSFSTIFPNTDINISIPNAIKKGEDHLLHFCTSSPVSVLESNTLRGGTGGGSGSGSGAGSGSASSSSSSSYSSSSYSFSGNNSSISSSRSASPPQPILVVPARARSKRPRPTTFSPRPHVTVPFLPPSSDAQPVSNISSDPESIAESYPPPPPPPLTLPMKKKKKKKSKVSFAAATSEAVDVDDDDDDDDETVLRQAQAPPARKCMHCEIQKTPQWRTGPMGPKTLCNACGVRYKSGRLFPEYRPAASPTFIPSIHSNSHKKVVEMRNKGTTQKPDCDLLGYIRRRE